jgi:hypothetical protein
LVLVLGIALFKPLTGRKVECSRHRYLPSTSCPFQTCFEIGGNAPRVHFGLHALHCNALPPGASISTQAAPYAVGQYRTRCRGIHGTVGIVGKLFSASCTADCDLKRPNPSLSARIESVGPSRSALTDGGPEAKKRASESWAATTGRVESSEVKADAEGHAKGYALHIAYSYKAGDDWVSRLRRETLLA